MWKWLAGFAAVYGLLSVALLLGPGQARTRLDLDLRRLNLHTDPTSRYELIKSEAAQFVRWHPGLGPGEMHLIAMPLKSPPEATGIRTMLRASQPITVLVGIREASDAVYYARVSVDQDWQASSLPLDGFKLSPRSEDPNGQLDLEDIRGVLVVLPPQGDAGRLRWGEHLRRPGLGERPPEGFGDPSLRDPSARQPGDPPRQPGEHQPGAREFDRPRPGEVQRDERPRPDERRRPDGQGRPRPPGAQHPGEFAPPPGADPPPSGVSPGSANGSPPPLLYIDIQVLEFVTTGTQNGKSR